MILLVIVVVGWGVIAAGAERGEQGLGRISGVGPGASVRCAGGRGHTARALAPSAPQSRKFVNWSGMPKSVSRSFAIAVWRSSRFFPDTRSC